MPTQTKNILIYRLGSLGDTVIALPCFNRIREIFPQANITLLTNKPVASKAAPLEAVLGTDFFFDQTLSYPVGTRNPLLINRLIYDIRRLGIDIVINITASRSRKADIRDRLFFSAAGVSEFIGFDQSPEDYEVSLDPHTGEFEWEAFRLKRKIEALGDFNLMADRYWDLHLLDSEIQKAETLLGSYSNDSKIIAANVGTKMKVKDWGVDNWIDLMRLLGKELRGYKLVIIGVKEENEIAEKCLEAWAGEGINLCGKSSPRVSAAILRKTSIFVGHDSGPTHLAACVGTPCVAIFSCINRPRQWFPKGENNRILMPSTACAASGIKKCVNPDMRCVRTIQPVQVVVEVLKLLQTIQGQ